MTIPDRVQLIVQDWLQSHDEDAQWLRGGHCRERGEAYGRVLDHVARVLNRELEWREWITMQDHVREIVRGLVGREGESKLT